MSIELRFRMSRADYVALSMAVSRRPLLFRIGTVVLALSVLVFAAAMIEGKHGRSLLSDVLTGDREWWPTYGFIALVSLGLLFRHVLVAFNAAAGYGRMPLADKDVVVRLDDTAAAITATDFDWRFEWPAVARVVESRSHLVLAVDTREGLPLPRRAVADDAAWQNLGAFVRAHVTEGTAHERA